MIEEILQNCIVDGLVVRLPAGQLNRETYTKVADRLKNIGGKWKGGKVFGFVFEHDPTDLLADLQAGKARNLKKEFQFFETPTTIADQLAELADIRPSSVVLEPSAGRGAILRRLPYFRVAKFYCYELNPQWHPELAKLATVLGEDFLRGDFKSFDRIVANPPFTKNQDIQHIRRMYDTLASGGRLASVASTHWQYSSNKTEVDFCEWLIAKNAQIISLPDGSFKESGTNVPAVIIVIDKAALPETEHVAMSAANHSPTDSGT